MFREYINIIQRQQGLGGGLGIRASWGMKPEDVVAEKGRALVRDGIENKSEAVSFVRSVVD